jgi:hypothetical protein
MTPQASLQNQTRKPAPTDGSRTASQSNASSNAQPPTSDAAVTEVPLQKLPRRQAPDFIERLRRMRRRHKRRRAGRFHHATPHVASTSTATGDRVVHSRISLCSELRYLRSTIQGEDTAVTMASSVGGNYYSNGVFDYR